MPEQQATAGTHSRIIQIFGDGNVVGSQPYLSLRVPSLLPRSLSATSGNEAALLGPGAGVTAFVGREELLASFVKWANSHSPERPVSVRVVYGGAGVGKTRFAMELCRALGPGWRAGFVDGIEARRFLRQSNLADWGWQAPTLVVFDYALTLLDVLPDWMDELCAIRESAHPLRILLLERQAGEGQGGWLERAFPRRFGISGVCPADLLDGEPLRLPGMADCAIQRGIMQEMLTQLGSGLVLPPDDAVFCDRLARTDWAGAPLYLMMAAMVMHRQGSVGEVLHLGRADLAHAVAGHELERLRRACQGGQAGRGSLELFLPHMAALATLCGGLPEGLVSDCLRREKEAIGCESLDTAVVKRALTELLPDEGRGGIAPIRPDIVGEAFVLSHLGNGQTRDGQRAVLRAFADRPSEVAAVLVRCVQDFAPRGADAASAREAQDQQRALDGLRAVGEMPDLPLALLLVVVGALPQQTLALRTLAVEWQGRAVDMLRQRAAVDPRHRAELAGNLNDFANRLSAAGQREEALNIAGEAATLYRELADANPGAFRPNLAMSLNTFANRLSDAGKRQEAFKVAAEAVTIRRELADTYPDVFRPDLAMSFNNLATFLSDAGKREEALTIADEAVTLYRELAAANPDAFRPNLAMSLNNLATFLSNAGKREEALTIAGEAVAIRRELADANPDAFRPDLAMSLNNLANRLSDAGKREEALTIAGEAVAIRRELADANPDAFRPNLAMSLNNLATFLSNAGKREEALTIAGEAVAIRCELAAANPDAFRPDLAMSLNNLAICLSDTEQREEALKAARQSATLYWVLFQKFPEYYGNYLETTTITWLSLRHGISPEEASSMFQQDPETHIRALLEDAEADDLPSTPAP